VNAPFVDTARSPRPRLGFAGVGWIGRHRLEALIHSDLAEVAAIADPAAECRRSASRTAPAAVLVDGFDGLGQHDLDGMVIATPSALHAAQSIAALERGLAVFCQKPLGRTAAEVQRVVDAARRADRLLEVDFCYRYTAAMRALRAAVSGGELGRVFAANLVFHNAYGPDKPWFYDRAASGGGCVMDLGIHLVDLLMWALDFPEVLDVQSQLLAGGRPLTGADSGPVEDYAIVQMQLDGDVAVQLACSWRLPAGRDAVIEASFYGTEGGATLRNVNGSFYDLRAERHLGTATTVLSEPPDVWGGRAICEWAARVARGDGFDPRAQQLVEGARVLDRIYDCSRAGRKGAD
jgi:predicted dehydrogenase